MTRGLFITGTDTNVGKTVLSAAVIHRCRGVAPLRYWKPVQTGISQDDDTAEVERLAALAAGEVLKNGYRFADPVSPHLAAEREDNPVNVHRLNRMLEEGGGTEETRWIIEGAGGILVPLNRANTFAEFVSMQRIPAVIAARSGLGTINHTLLTLEALRSREIPVAGVVLIGEPNEDNAGIIGHMGKVPILGQMPRFEPLTPQALEQWALEHFDPHGILKRFLLEYSPE
ncbi:MAG: dethiobiotin synthase [Bryobacteraceae bacterium]